MKIYILSALIVVVLVLAGCSQKLNGGTNGSDTSVAEVLSAGGQSESGEVDISHTSFDLQLSGTPTTVTESDVVITQSGTYEFTGDYSSITVNVDKDIDEDAVYLVLNNASISNENSTPINIMEAKDVIIVLEGENSVTQGEIITTDEEFPSAAVYSRADTVITGDGSITVVTSYNDGINSRDDLIIDGATITVTAVEDGIVGKDLLTISQSDITVTAGKDGLKASNDEDADKGNLVIASGNFNIVAQNDGISAEQTLQIDDGNFNITSGGGFVEVLNEITRGEGSGNTVQPSSLLEDSMKGLKGQNLILNGGQFDISSYEDAVHADNNLTVNGGIYNIISGDDALHADIALLINDIDLVVENAYEGLEGETVTINDGNILINVLDDAINASSESGYVKITDGTISLKAMGDGIDSNGDLTIEGGEIIIDVDAVYAGGDSELDVSGVYNISGGSVVDENGNELEPTQMGGAMGGPAGGPGGGQRPQNGRP